MGQDSNEIRREIEETRARMGETVEALGYKADVPARVKDAVSERVETVKGTIADAVSGVKNTVKSTIDQTTGRIGEVTSSVSDRAGDAAGSVTDRISDAKYAARRGVGVAIENPIGLALGALAVGFLAGLIAPVTDLEREKIGPLRDELLDKAQTVAGDVVEHGKQVLQETAQATLETAQRSAQSHGREILGGGEEELGGES